MKVCLIIPPSLFLLDEKVFPSLGILRVAAVLEQEKVPIEILDLNGVGNYIEALSVYLEATDADVFGITATTPQMPAVAKIIAAIRGASGHAKKIILGGPHPTLVNAAKKIGVKRGQQGRAHRALLQLFQLVDTVVAGDGEVAIWDALKMPDKLIDADDVASPMFLSSAQLNKFPLPSRHLIDLKSYRYKIDNVATVSLIGQLGCPMPCSFCGGRDSAMLRRVRLRSTDAVLSEVRHLFETYGFSGFMFLDDELNVNRQMLELMQGLYNLQRDLGVEFRCRGFVKAELFTQEQADAMHRAGFRQLLCGFESGSPRILTNIRKMATREDNSRMLQHAKQAGISVKALMSIGHPGESQQTIQETEDWLLETEPDDLDVTIITTYPGSPYYDYSEQDAVGMWKFTAKNGDALYSQELDYLQTADYYKGDPDGGYKSYVWTDFISADELVELRGNLETKIRRRLNIPFYGGAATINYEHSMGALPSSLLRASA